MSLDVEVLTSDTKCRVELNGRLDTATAPEFDEKMASIDCNKHKVQVIDLSQLEYISSAGVRSLFKAKKAASSHDAQVLLVNPQPQVKKVFEIIKALPKEAVFTSEEELDNYLDNMQRARD